MERVQVDLIYPERRTVTAEQVIMWAGDAFANEETDELATTLDDAIRVLEDLGHITVKGIRQ